MMFGGQTVVFVTVTENPAVRDRYNNPQIVRAEVPVRGCRFRPADSGTSEATDLGTTILNRWKITAPPNRAVMAAKAVDEVKVDGVSYEIIGGIRPFTDMGGSLFKVTVIVERRDG